MKSVHVFMFPFRFDKITGSPPKGGGVHDYYKEVDFDERTKIDGTLKAKLSESKWRYRSFAIESDTAYNEYSYFHDFVRDTLFNRGDFTQNRTSYYFEKEGTAGSYIIETEGKSYELDLGDISLHLFDTGVGILSFHLQNSRYDDLEDILLINDLGRRVYPQFVSRTDEDGKYWTDETKNTLLPQSITVRYGDIEVTERFEVGYDRAPKGIRLAKTITDTLGSLFFAEDPPGFFRIGHYLIRPIIDDRMFVLSWYGNNELADELTDKRYLDDERWYRYLFVDGRSFSIANPSMQEEIVKRSTYDRWVNNQTLYGVSRYSFVALTDRGWFSTNILRRHMESVYYQMTVLLLAQRASILRFSDEVTALSDLDGDAAQLSERTSVLYKNYIRFINKLYFREVSPQEQGIELYDMARRNMRIDEDVKDLDNEIAELHSYVSMLDEQRRNREMEKLSRLGYAFLPPTLMAGLLGMNVIPESWMNYPAMILTFVLIGCGTWWLAKRNDIDIVEIFRKKDSHGK